MKKFSLSRSHGNDHTWQGLGRKYTFLSSRKNRGEKSVGRAGLLLK